MIEKIYEVVCDYCGQAITHQYISFKHTKEVIKELGGVIHKGKHFCDEECYENYKKTGKAIWESR